MTEKEQLEKGLEKSVAMQQMKDINSYLDSLADRIEKTGKRNKDAAGIYFITWVLWIAAGFVGKNANSLYEIFYIIALMYSSMRTIQYSKAIAESIGAIKMLEIIGLLSPRGSSRLKRKKRVWSKGMDIVRGWMKKKEKVRKDAYAPA